MLPGRKYRPEDIIRIVQKRIWFLVVPIFVATFVALLISRSKPDLFTSETLVQVLGQRVPEGYVRSTVTSTVDERLKTITEVIKSRSQLEQVINEFNLYPRERLEQPMEEVVEAMRAAVSVEPAAGAPGRRPMPGQVTAFKVSFTYEDKGPALSVTQRLTDLLIAENTRMRSNSAEKTSEFLQGQLADAARQLKEQEQKLEAFRLRHVGRLPNQLESNMQAVQTTQMERQSVVESLARDRDRKMILERLYNEASAESVAVVTPTVAAPSAPGQGADPNALPTAATAQQQLALAKARLAQLELRLKPEHPDVIRARRQVADLGKQAEAEAREDDTRRQAQSTAAASATPTQPSPAARAITPEEQNRRARLREQRAEIDSLNRQIAFKEEQERQLSARIADYRSRIESIPGIESEWVELTRDYDTMQQSYRTLLAKSEESKVAANLELQQIGEQFRVLDPPRVSDQAASSKRLQVNIGGFAIGLLLGLGMIGFLEFRDTSFRTESDVLGALALPVLAAVPFAPNAADVAAARRRRMATLGVAGSLFIAAGVLAFYLKLWKFVV
jgi:polysaccharide chain length determinant protein (PEP-CTERM system associated)